MNVANVIHERGEGSLLLKDGDGGSVSWDIEIRGSRISGDITGNQGLIKRAAKHGWARLRLSTDHSVSVSVFRYRAGFASIEGELPEGSGAKATSDGSYFQPVHSWQARADRKNDAVRLKINGRARFTFCSADHAREFGLELLEEAVRAMKLPNRKELQ
jgi:hypothetical protein